MRKPGENRANSQATCESLALTAWRLEGRVLIVALGSVQFMIPSVCWPIAELGFSRAF
jgi:hypothetical protein